MKIEDKLQSDKLKTKSGVKKHIFDIIAVIILIAVVMVSLDVFKLLDLNKLKFVDFLSMWLPYLISTLLLNTDLYKKGVFVGKATDKFNAVIDAYSALANGLTGEQIKGLYSFCYEYNIAARKNMQLQILREEGLSFEDFDESIVTSDGNKPPLKARIRKQLKLEGYTSRQIKAIYKAKKAKIKGINVNILLSSMNISDVTNIGANERMLQVKQFLSSSSIYILSTLFLSMIGIRDVINWGWGGFVVILFKVAYLFARCYMSYFQGYDDITINLANHFTRKCDILKMYLDYKPEKVEE